MMKKPTLTQTEIAQEFLRGRNCAQCTLGEYAQSLGYDQEETDRMLACFGGGMELGQTCGAVVGGLIAIGMACEDREKAWELGERFRSQFKDRFGTCMCRELLGYDMSQPDQAEQARASGKLVDACPNFVAGALEILDNLLDE